MDNYNVLKPILYGHGYDSNGEANQNGVLSTDVTICRLNGGNSIGNRYCICYVPRYTKKESIYRLGIIGER